jgi:TPR repeat protein
MTKLNRTQSFSARHTFTRGVLCSLLSGSYAAAWAKSDSCDYNSRHLQHVVTRSEIDSVIAFRTSQADSAKTNTIRSVITDEKDSAGSNGVRFELAATYIAGSSSVKNSRKAFDWFLSAAQHGDVEAQMIVAYLYANGIGTSSDCQEASKWFCRAGDSGIEEIKFAMGTQCSEAGERAPASSLHSR